MTDKTPDEADQSSSTADTASDGGSVAADIDAYTDQIASHVATRLAAQNDSITLDSNASQTPASNTAAINTANQLADRVSAIIQTGTEMVDGVDSNTTDSGRGVWWYDLNGLRITADPDHHIVGDRIGAAYRGLPHLANAPPKRVPNVTTEYIPASFPGSVNPLDEVADKLSKGIPIALEGEAGTGKNTLFDTIHGKTNRPLYRSQLGLDTSIFDLSNDRDVVAGTTVNNLGDLSMAAVFGGTWLGDEVGMLEGDISSHIHAAAERPGKRTVEIFGTDRVLTDLPEDEEWVAEKHLGEYIHPEFRIGATTNPISYGAVKEMNNAFRGRFSVKILDYIGPKEEISLLMDNTGIDADTAESLVQLANELRSMYRNDRLRCPISPRQLYNTVEYYTTHRRKPGDDPDRERITLADAAEAELVAYAQLPDDRTAIEDAINDEL